MFMDLTAIVRRHFCDVFSANRLDAFFYQFGIPIFMSLISMFVMNGVGDSELSALISAFSIFSALLVTAMFSIYSIALIPEKTSDDPIKKEQYERQKLDERKIISQLNDNISYLILIGVVIVLLSILLMSLVYLTYCFKLILCFFVLHYLGNFLFVVRKVHALLSAVR